MNPDRDALEGLVNKNDVGSAEGLPSVSPFLVEHLLERFKPYATAVPDLATVHAHNHQQVGEQRVISYLASLIPAPMQGAAHEPTETESASTDPRRPGTNRRG